MILIDCEENLCEPLQQRRTRGKKTFDKLCRRISSYFSDEENEFKEELNEMDVS